jgi:hypothetical protein
MTDRELLEAAAKAAGIYYWWSDGDVLTHDDGPGLYRVWNPLTDDGDALRLAVKMRLVIEVGVEATLVYQDDPGICELHDLDPYAATRRAIVRAAAAMTE